MKGWVALVGWPTADGLRGHPSAAGRAQEGRAQDSESSPVIDRRSTTVPRNQPVILQCVVSECTLLACCLALKNSSLSSPSHDILSLSKFLTTPEHCKFARRQTQKTRYSRFDRVPQHALLIWSQVQRSVRCSSECRINVFSDASPMLLA